MIKSLRFSHLVLNSDLVDQALDYQLPTRGARYDVLTFKAEQVQQDHSDVGYEVVASGPPEILEALYLDLVAVDADELTREDEDAQDDG